jgi:hypothetical protein
MNTPLSGPRGMPAWIWVVMALVHTALSAILWREWLDFKFIEASYTSEALAAAHFAIPASLVRSACVSSAVTALLWARAIWKAEPA